MIPEKIHRHKRFQGDNDKGTKQANSFVRARLEENCELLTDNEHGQIHANNYILNSQRLLRFVVHQIFSLKARRADQGYPLFSVY